MICLYNARDEKVALKVADSLCVSERGVSTANQKVSQRRDRSRGSSKMLLHLGAPEARRAKSRGSSLVIECWPNSWSSMSGARMRPLPLYALLSSCLVCRPRAYFLSVVFHGVPSPLANIPHPPIHPPTHPFIHPSTQLRIHLPTYPPTHPPPLLSVVVKGETLQG